MTFWLSNIAKMLVFTQTIDWLGLLIVWHVLEEYAYNDIGSKMSVHVLIFTNSYSTESKVLILRRKLSSNIRLRHWRKSNFIDAQQIPLVKRRKNRNRVRVCHLWAGGVQLTSGATLYQMWFTQNHQVTFFWTCLQWCWVFASFHW